MYAGDIMNDDEQMEQRICRFSNSKCFAVASGTVEVRLGGRWSHQLCTARVAVTAAGSGLPVPAADAKPGSVAGWGTSSSQTALAANHTTLPTRARAAADLSSAAACNTAV